MNSELPPDRSSNDPSAFDWLERSLILVVGLVGTSAAISLVTAMLGFRSDPVSNGVSVIAVVVGLGLSIRSWVRDSVEQGWTVAFVIVALCFAVLMGFRPSQNTNIDRDPAVYNTISRTLADAPSLFVTADEGPFEDNGDLRFSTAGVYDVRGDGELEFQFNHLAPALGGILYDLGGHRALFRMSAALTGIGLLAVGLVTRRLTRSNAAGLASIVVLGSTLPLIAIGRDSYSEPAAFAFIWLAVLAHGRATSSAPSRHGLVTGCLLGLAVMTRVDSLAYVAVLAIALSVDLLLQETDEARRTRRIAAQTIVAAVPGSMIALIDFRYLTGNYANDLSAQTRPLYFAVAASLMLLAVVATSTARWRWPARLVAQLNPVLGVVVPIGVVLALGVGWLVRPRLDPVYQTASNSYLENIQVNEGVTADGSRTYAEQSLVWMSWYLGPITLAMSIAGVGLAARRLFARRTPDSLLTSVFMLFLVMGTIYFWRPSITPDHIWAMRRFAPVLIPCLVIAALGAAVALSSRLAAPARSKEVAVGLLSLVFAFSALRTSLPVIAHRTQFGSVQVLDQLCEAIGPNAAVIFPEYEGNAAAVRAWCDVPVAIATESLTPDNLITLSQAWDAEGVQLYLVARNGDVINRYYPNLASEQFSTDLFVNDRWLERSTESAPDDYVTQNMRLVGQAVPITSGS